MKRIILWPYKMGSQGCKNLAQELDALRVFSNGRYRPRENHLIINWGNGGAYSPNWWLQARAEQILNFPDKVATAANKLLTFNAFLEAGDVSFPDYTQRMDVAEEWIHQGKRVYCRTKLTGKGGDGIVVARDVNDLVEAPLYTVGIEVRREYRAHVFAGNVIDVVQKRRRNNEEGNPEDVSLDIRNHSNGWVFCREGFDTPDNVKDEAIKAIAALGLDFGAVDIVTEKRTGNAYCLECNTAPGLEGSTIIKYAEAIRQLANN